MIPIKIVNNLARLFRSVEAHANTQVLDTQNCPWPGTRLTMIRLYTLQRFAHFSPQDSIASADSSHYMMFEKRMTETQSFRNINSLLRADHTKLTNPLPADPPLRKLHTTYSTILDPRIACGCTRKFLAWIISVPFEPGWRSIGRSHGYSGISKKYRQHWVL